MRSSRNGPLHRTPQDRLFMEEAEEEQGQRRGYTRKLEEVVSDGVRVSPESSQCRAICGRHQCAVFFQGERSSGGNALGSLVVNSEHGELSPAIGEITQRESVGDETGAGGVQPENKDIAHRRRRFEDVDMFAMGRLD